MPAGEHVSRRDDFDEIVQGNPDEVHYKTVFMKEGSMWDVHYTKSDPLVPDEGQYVRFKMLKDGDGNEVIRSGIDPIISEDEIGSGKEYTRMWVFEHEVKVERVDTEYDRDPTKEGVTVVKKTVHLVDVGDNE